MGKRDFGASPPPRPAPKERSLGPFRTQGRKVTGEDKKPTIEGLVARLEKRTWISAVSCFVSNNFYIYQTGVLNWYNKKSGLMQSINLSDELTDRISVLYKKLHAEAEQKREKDEEESFLTMYKEAGE